MDNLTISRKIPQVYQKSSYHHYNGRLLKHSSKNSLLKVLFFTEYFLYESRKNVLWTYNKKIDAFYNKAGNISDSNTILADMQLLLDYLCDYYSNIEREVKSFYNKFEYLGRPVKILLSFIKTYQILPERTIQNTLDMLDDLKYIYIYSWNKLLDEKESFNKLHTILTNESSTYRNLKRGNPFLKFRAEPIGGFALGYTGASVDLNFFNSTNIGNSFGASCESMVELFTSDSRKDKFKGYEQGLELITNYIHQSKEYLENQFEKILVEIKYLAKTLHLQILNWLYTQSFSKNDTRFLLKYINYLDMTEEKNDYFYNERYILLDKLLNLNYITSSEKKTLNKIFINKKL